MNPGSVSFKQRLTLTRRAMSTEITNVDNPINEPTTIVPAFTQASRDNPSGPVLTAFIRRPDQSGVTKTADYDAYMRDIAETRARGAALEAKRQQNKPSENPKVELSAVDEVLNALETAADDFENSFGKPNQPLIDAKMEVDRLRHELTAAESRLTEIEARGDSVKRLTDAVRVGESQLQSLVSRAESEEINRLAAEHFGWAIPQSKIPNELRREFALHASVMAFKSLYVPRSIVNPGQQPSAEALQSQLQLVGERLTALRDHLEQE
jgi:archaellum component FlaC